MKLIKYAAPESETLIRSSQDLVNTRELLSISVARREIVIELESNCVAGD